MMLSKCSTESRSNSEQWRWLGRRNIGAASGSIASTRQQEESLPKDIGLRSARVPTAISSGDADEKSKACDKEV